MIIGNPLLLKKAADSTPDPVTRSLRFNHGSDSALYIEPTVDHDSSTVFTFSCWAKLGEIGADTYLIFSAGHYPNSTDQAYLYFSFNTACALRVTLRSAAGTSATTYSSTDAGNSGAVFRDPSAFYHLLMVRDGASLKAYVNNTVVINETISATTAYGVGDGLPMHVGSSLRPTSSGINNYWSFDGLLADVYFTDGYAKVPTDFIESNGYGGYKPKEYTGSFGTNGFHLKFDDSSDIGADDAGSNDFTAIGLASADIRTDVPTDSFCVMSPIDKGSGVTLSEGNLKAVCDNNWDNVRGTMGATSGKFYYEVVGNIAHSTRWNAGVDINQKCEVDTYNSNTGSIVYALYDGVIYNGTGSAGGSGNFNSSYYVSATQDQSETNARIGVAVDIDAGKVWFRFNGGTWQNSGGDPTSASSSGTVTFTANSLVHPLFAGYGGTFTVYYQESEWTDTAPTDYGEWKTSRLDAPTVTPEENFDTILWQGDGVDDRDITGLGFDPTDGVLTWIKNRSDSGGWHVLFDSVRGAGNQLATNETDAELASASNVGGKVSQWNTDGFRAAQGSGTTPLKSVNESSDDYVAWNWKAHQGGSTSYSNTLTLDVRDNYGSGSGWGTTKLEVWEGSTKLTDITNPPSSSSKIYNIKTNDLDKIKIVWYVDSSAGDWYNMYAVLKNSSNTTLASWDGNSWSGNSSDAPSDDDNFYLPSNFDSTNAATTGVVEAADADTERYNSSAGFTIIKYAGAGSTDGDTKTLDHSLGVPLEFVIAKARTSNDGYDNGDWIVWHKDLASSKYLYLNSSSAQRTEASGYNLISTATSGTQHQVVVNNGSDNSSYNYHYLNSGPDNGTGEDYILYGWAGVEGYSKFGKYTGNGSTDGPFIYTGFRPAFVLWKRATGSSNSWNIMDNKREGYNPQNDLLFPDTQGSESNVTDQDLLSNGFKLRTTGAGRNASSETFIYAAFAEQPFAAPSNSR